MAFERPTWITKHGKRIFVGAKGETLIHASVASEKRAKARAKAQKDARSDNEPKPGDEDYSPQEVKKGKDGVWRDPNDKRDIPFSIYRAEIEDDREGKTWYEKVRAATLDEAETLGWVVASQEYGGDASVKGVDEAESSELKGFSEAKTDRTVRRMQDQGTMAKSYAPKRVR